MKIISQYLQESICLQLRTIYFYIVIIVDVGCVYFVDSDVGVGDDVAGAGSDTGAPCDRDAHDVHADRVPAHQSVHRAQRDPTRHRKLGRNHR